MEEEGRKAWLERSGGAGAGAGAGEKEGGAGVGVGMGADGRNYGVQVGRSGGGV